LIFVSNHKLLEAFQLLCAMSNRSFVCLRLTPRCIFAIRFASSETVTLCPTMLQVRQDDIDMAIRVMLSSFIGAQKLAVMKHLKDKFQVCLISQRCLITRLNSLLQKYMLYKRSHEELLFFLLKQMIQEETYRQDFQRSGDRELILSIVC
jgi:hypothetical protein